MKVHGTSIMPTTIRPMPARSNAAFALSAGQATDAAKPAAGVTFRGTEAPTASAATVMQHWGTSNAEGDLNSDGIVDAQDLAMVLNAQNDTQSLVTQNWGAGSDNASNGGDHNGDGSVDAMDLAMALNGGNAPRSLEAPADPAPQTPEAIVAAIVDATFAARDADADGELVAGDFANAHGKAGKVFHRLDLDQSGSVGREELSKALLGEFDRFREQFPGKQPAAFARRWMDALTTGQPLPDMGQHQRVQQLFAKKAPVHASHQFLSVRA